jgi:hypothetical protein
MTSAHTIFKHREISPCPWHQGQCAYTGSESDRCPLCHDTWEHIWALGDDESHLHREMQRWQKCQEAARRRKQRRAA